MKQSLIQTRPLADATASTESFRVLGLQVINAPVMQILCEPTQNIPNDVDTLVLTSPHGLTKDALALLPHTLHVHCVGERAATLCRDNGLRVVSVSANSAQLIQRLRSAKPAPKHLLYLSGRDVSSDITAALLPETMQISRIITYRAEAVRTLPASAKKALKQPSPWVLFYSKRSAELFSDMLHLNELDERIPVIRAFCLSESIARTAASLGFSPCSHATEANEASLIALLAAQVKLMI